jgi:hypothetical protein
MGSKVTGKALIVEIIPDKNTKNYATGPCTTEESFILNISYFLGASLVEKIVALDDKFKFYQCFVIPVQ